MNDTTDDTAALFDVDLRARESHYRLRIATTATAREMLNGCTYGLTRPGTWSPVCYASDDLESVRAYLFLHVDDEWVRPPRRQPQHARHYRPRVGAIGIALTAARSA